MRLKVYLIFFLPFLLSHSLSLGVEFNEACANKGGQLKKKRCYCQSENRYIDPYSGHCVAKAILDFSRLNRSAKGLECNSTNAKPLPRPRLGPDEVEESALCANPAKYICQPSLNPYLNQEDRARKLFYQLNNASENDPSVKKYIASKTKKKNTNCFELDKESYQECLRLRNIPLSKALYTRERVDKSQALFEQAKVAIITALEKREKAVRELRIEDTLPILEEMKAAVAKSTLIFGSLDSEQDYNAYAVRSRKLDHFPVRLEGSILRVDDNPESLIVTFLHELSHHVGSYLPSIKKAADARSPFNKELQCLRRIDSVAAKSGDSDCIFRMAYKYEKSNPPLAEELFSVGNQVRLLPGAEWKMPTLPINEGLCQKGQVDEAFSDFLATEAMMNLEKLPPPDSLVGISSSNGQKIINVRQRMSLIPNFIKKLALHCADYQYEQTHPRTDYSIKDSHPSSEDRLNGIFLAHPLVKMALGCSSNNVHNLRDLNQPPLTSGKVYCGMHLYLTPKRK